MGVEPLSVVPQGVACTVCGKTSESTAGWFFRKEKHGKKSVEINYCPSCAVRVQQELEEQSRDADVGSGILFGGVAAAIGAAAWFGLVLLTDRKFGVAAIGVGWLVGRGVLMGAGNKRSSALQLVSAVWAVVALVAGEYLIINHIARQAIQGFHGWLSVSQFLAVYPKILAAGNWLFDVLFYVFALLAAIAQLQPIKLRPRK
jgi:hypothetical protein